MEIVPVLFFQLSSLVLIALVGFTIVRLGILKAAECKTLSTILIDVIIPCAVIRALQLPLTEEKLHGFLVSISFALLIHFVWIILSTALGKWLHLSGVEEASLMYPNSGNLILPLAATVFGEEYVFYACLFNVVQLIFIWTHGVTVVREERDLHLKNILLNVNLISVGIGLVFFLFQIRLPLLLANTMGLLGSMLGPLSMLVTGMVMAEADLGSILRRARIWLVCAGRLLVFPMVIIFLTALSGYLKIHRQELFIFQISMMAVSAPPATLLTQFSVMYDKDSFTAGSTNLISIMLCVLTMPAMLALFTYLVR
jgi:predicted permease